RIHLIGAVGTDVRLGRVFGSSNNIGGQRFVSNTGAIMAGNLDMHTSRLKIGATKTLPSHHQLLHREMVIWEQHGKDDELLINIKKADGSYRWHKVNLTPK